MAELSQGSPSSILIVNADGKVTRWDPINPGETKVLEFPLSSTITLLPYTGQNIGFPTGEILPPSGLPPGYEFGAAFPTQPTAQITICVHSEYSAVPPKSGTSQQGIGEG